MTKIRTLVAACGAVALLGGMGSLPARADDDGWRGRGHEQREHEWRERERAEHERREWCEHHPYQCEHPPAVVYETAPPPVVVTPPPTVVYQPAPPPPAPSLDIVIPLHLH